MILKINSHQCILYGKEVFLTPIEFKILLYLFEHQGSVVSSETLFEAVWKEKYLDNNNTVMAHIARLREKLHEEPRKPKLIKTVWGSAISLKNRNPLIRKLLTQYFVTTGILLAFLVMIPLVIRFIAGTRTWYGTEPIYYILRFCGSLVVLCCDWRFTDMVWYHHLLYDQSHRLFE